MARKSGGIRVKGNGHRPESEADTAVITARLAEALFDESHTAAGAGRVPQAITKREAKSIAKKALKTTTPKKANGNGGPRSLGPLGAPAAPTPSDILDEMERGGPAFGKFISAVGLGVAEAQEKLDQTLVTTAKALSEQQIDVIAIFEQQIKDDDGTMDKGVIHMQKLPLINYLMPTAYQWSRVYLQADMQVKEFSSTNGFNIKGKSDSFSLKAGGSAGTFGWSANASVGYSRSTYEAEGRKDSATDESAGQLHLEATLEPRSDIQVPRPFILQKGPRVTVMADARVDLDKDGNATNDPAAIKGRSVKVNIKVLKTNGQPNDGKTVLVSVDDPTINYDASATTNGSGDASITLKRTGASFDPKTVVQTNVRVAFGLVAQTLPITL